MGTSGTIASPSASPLPYQSASAFPTQAPANFAAPLAAPAPAPAPIAMEQLLGTGGVAGTQPAPTTMGQLLGTGGVAGTQPAPMEQLLGTGGAYQSFHPPTAGTQPGVTFAADTAAGRAVDRDAEARNRLLGTSMLPAPARSTAVADRLSSGDARRAAQRAEAADVTCFRMAVTGEIESAQMGAGAGRGPLMCVFSVQHGADWTVVLARPMALRSLRVARYPQPLR